MKLIKKAAVLAVVLIMIVSLFACGAEKGENLTGKWSCDIDMTQMMNDEIKDVFGEDNLINAKLIVAVLLSIDESNHYTLSVDDDATLASIEAYFDAAEENVIKMMYDNAEAEAMDKETFDEAFESAYNVSVSDFVSEMFDAIDITEISSDLTDIADESGVIKAKDGKLYFAADEKSFDDNSYAVYTRSDTQLVISEVCGNALGLDELDGAIPMTFVKK